MTGKPDSMAMWLVLSVWEPWGWERWPFNAPHEDITLPLSK